MPDRIIVTGADANYYGLLRDLLNSLTDRGVATPVGVLDVGFEPQQRQALERDGYMVVTPDDLRLRYFAAMREVSPELIDKLVHYDPQHAMGRPIFCLGSSIISFHCAIQPTVRATANSTVNMEVGKPIALSVMPE